jgi:hypothetical protein
LREYGDDVRRRLPPVPLALAFVSCINLGDVPGLVALMTPDHRLQIFDEPPVVGRDANERAWTGYLESFPSYSIYPHQIAATASPRFSATPPEVTSGSATPRNRRKR